MVANAILFYILLFFKVNCSGSGKELYIINVCKDIYTYIERLFLFHTLFYRSLVCLTT